MKRFAMTTLLAASAMLVGISISASAQQTACSLVGKSTQYNLEAYLYQGIPSFGFKMVSPGTICVEGKDQYLIKGAKKPLDSMAQAEKVLDALRTLNETGFTGVADIENVLKYVAEVETADAARPKKQISEGKAPSDDPKDKEFFKQLWTDQQKKK